MQVEEPADPSKGALFLSPSTGRAFTGSGFAAWFKKRVKQRTGVDMSPYKLRCEMCPPVMPFTPKVYCIRYSLGLKSSRSELKVCTKITIRVTYISTRATVQSTQNVLQEYFKYTSNVLSERTCCNSSAYANACASGHLVFITPSHAGPGTVWWMNGAPRTQRQAQMQLASARSWATRRRRGSDTMISGGACSLSYGFPNKKYHY
jgi:hypothetical protein